MRKKIMLLAVLGVGLLLAGCTQTQQGQANPVSSAAPPASGKPTVSIPPRPKELRLDGIEPCRLFTPAQVQQLQVSRELRSGTSGDYFNSPRCAMTIDGPPREVYHVLTITKEGIEPWLTGDRNAEAKLTSVAGFPAVDLRLLGTTGAHCLTGVDVAKGQQLLVDRGTTSDPLSQQEMCQRAHRVAEMALQTLQTLR